MAEYFEDRIVGAHLRAHRIRLGVARSEMIGPEPLIGYDALRFAEKAQRPDLDIVETYHRALITAFVGAAEARNVPLARREQWYASGRDEQLWHIALERNPRVVWWWGVLSNTTPRGAWCYLCNTLIHGYDVGRGVTPPARRTIMAHRLTHINELTADLVEPKETNTK